MSKRPSYHFNLLDGEVDIEKENEIGSYKWCIVRQIGHTALSVAANIM